MFKNQNVAIQAQPQFVSIFRKSEAVSKTKRKSYFVLKPPKPPKATQGKEYIEEIKYILKIKSQTQWWNRLLRMTVKLIRTK